MLKKVNDGSKNIIMDVAECYCDIDCEFYPEDKTKEYYRIINYNEEFKEMMKWWVSLGVDLVCCVLWVCMRVCVCMERGG